MNIGDFFVSLGVKGGDKAAGTVQDVKDKMEGLGEMSLKTKVAIAGVIFGLQRMVADSANIGSGLSKFTNYTGLSTKALQEYQHAARQVGVSNEEVTSTIVGLQRAMAKMQFRGEAPEGINNLINLLRGDFDLERAYKDPFYVLQQLQKALSQNKDIGFGIMNEIAETFGLSQDMIQALRREAFNPSIMQDAITYSEREIRNLENINAMWVNIGNEIEKAYGKFFASGDGEEFVKLVGELTTSIIDLVNSLLELTKNAKLIEGLNSLVIGLSGITKVTSDAAKATGDYVGEAMEDPSSALDKALSVPKGIYKDISRLFFAPPQIESPSQGRAPQSVQVNQEFTFMGGGEENISRVTRSFEDGVLEAYRQLPQSEAN
tara:strand:- start:22849 stop:23976 length:1128 start_codon:yes stop_codon:yes gene_type:complete